MLALDLSAIYFRSSRFQDTFLIAHFEEPDKFKPGEFTSDLLGYFGFGMGSYRMPEGSPPEWSKGIEFFKFPDMQAELQNPETNRVALFTSIVSRLHQLLQWYADRDVFFNSYDVRTFLNLAASYTGGYVTPRMVDSISITPFSEGHPMSVGVTFMEVNANGSVFLGFGGPEVEGTPPGVDAFYLRGSDARFDWHHSSQLGTPTNAMHILRSMRSLRYSTKSEEDRISEIDHIYINLHKIKDAV